MNNLIKRIKDTKNYIKYINRELDPIEAKQVLRDEIKLLEINLKKKDFGIYSVNRGIIIQEGIYMKEALKLYKQSERK